MAPLAAGSSRSPLHAHPIGPWNQEDMTGRHAFSKYTTMAAGALGLALVFDVIVGRSLWHAWKARSSFIETPAEVLRSELGASDEGGSYFPIVEYRYTFDGAEHDGKRVNYSRLMSSDPRSADATVRKYEAGSTVMALVNPADPNDAVLDASNEFFPGTTVLFMTSFHGMGLGFLLMAIAGYRARHSSGDPERARYIETETENDVVIKKPMYSAAAIALIALIGSTFIATFPVAFRHGFQAPLATVLPIWGGCFALAAVLGGMRWLKKRSPKSYIHIDRRRGLYSYPAGEPGSPLDEVLGVKSTSRPTGTSHNGVVQHHIRYVAKTTGRDVALFDVKMSEEDGKRLEELLHVEFLGR